MFVRRAFTRALTLATVLSLLVTSMVFADTLVADSDALTNGNQTNVFLSSEDGMTQTFNVALAIQCASKNAHIDGDTTVSMDATASSVPTGGSLSAAPATITRPATWPADGADCPEGGATTASVNSLVSVTAPAAGETDQNYTFQLRWTTNDDGVRQVSGANVAIHFTVKGTGNTGGGTGPANTPPVVDAGAPVSGAEGSPISLDASASDDGGTPTVAWTYAVVSADAGATCSFADATAIDTTITCTDDGTFTATLTANDGVNPAVSDSTTITVSNALPAPNAGADQTVNEGTLVSLSGLFTDAGSNDTHTQAWSVTANGGSITGSGNSFSFRPGDNGSYTVTYTVTDDDGGQASDTAVITVNNLAPTTSNASVSGGLIAGGFRLNASFNYSDAGWLDTHTGSSITWTVNGTAVSALTAPSTVTAGGDVGDPAFETGSVSSTLTLNPGCYTVAASGTALDDDGGSTPVTLTTGYESTQLDVPTLSFLSPIRDNERNIAKYGNVVPVKVAATSSCNPGQPYALDLYVTWVVGSGGEVTDSTPVIIAESVSNADSGAKMRNADGFQIYNLTTKNMTVGKDHTVQIRLGSTSGPVLLAAVLQPKK